MSAPKIPPRNPIHDEFTGVVLQVDEHYLLASTLLKDSTVVYEGKFIVRYGVVFLGKPHMSIVPGLLALDYGEFLTGENAWHFLMRKSNLHPRGDVVGYRNDGEDDMVVVKSLDLMYPLQVLVYADDEATKPLARVAAVITPQPHKLPERLREYATIQPSIAAWQETNS